MTTTPVPVGVVGAGNMGSNHLRVYDELPETDLVEVVEPDPDRAAEVRDEYDVRVLDHPDDIQHAEAVTVAIPNEFHRETTETCLCAGLDVLVEKPLAPTVEDARAITDLADERDAILQVGHIERFNPAVQTLRQLLKQQTVISFEAHRLGPFNDHLAEESVVFDLMIHDLDIVDSLVDSCVDELDALGATPRSSNIDYAVTQFSFENGVLGVVTASHVTNSKVRALEVTTEEAYIMLDYQEQSIVVQRRGTERTTTLLDKGGYRTERITESPYIQNREPLKNELEHFIECVREREAPRASGEGGVRAVEFAKRVEDQLQEGT